MDSVTHLSLTDHFPRVISHLFPPRFNRIISATPWLAWIMALLLVAGCGPARSADHEATLRSEVTRIAQEFAADHDLTKARTALEGLEVANPRQFLMLQTEELIAANTDPALTASLVKLTDALGIQSMVIRTYAAQQGLVEPTPTFVLEPVAAAPTLPPTATPTTAASPTADASIATSASITASVAAVSLDLPTPTAQSDAPVAPQGKATGLINVRSGPGTEFAAVATLNPDESVALVGKTPAGDWWQISLANGATGWVFGQLLTTSGDVATVAVAADIPTPPPTVAPVAVAEQPTALPTETPSVAPAPVTEGPDFRLVEKRLWDVFENGGSKNGPTVTCGEKRELHVYVRDANGNPLNGVAVQALLGAREILVTGAQGKGDGKVEFVLGGGQDITVVRDADGREVTADTVYGLTTDPRAIPFEYLIAGQYCADNAACDAWVNDPRQPPPCLGHYSWTVTFQRKY